MLLHTFKTQEERKRYGGSAFLEIQFCDMPPRTSVKRLVDARHVRNWKDDSLYICLDDAEAFGQAYSRIFDCGTYNNGKTGTVDLCGINYYAPALIDTIIERLNKEKPQDHEVLKAWLIRAKAHNGFNILGL